MRRLAVLAGSALIAAVGAGCATTRPDPSATSAKHSAEAACHSFESAVVILADTPSPTRSDVSQVDDDLQAMRADAAGAARASPGAYGRLDKAAKALVRDGQRGTTSEVYRDAQVVQAECDRLSAPTSPEEGPG